MKSLIFFLPLIVLLNVNADTARACSCESPKSPAQELERAAAVFAGKVVEIMSHKQTADPFLTIEVVFNVETIWKGAGDKTVSVFTSAHSDNCGYRFKRGRTYLVYAYRHLGGQVSTSICSRTRRLKNAHEDLKELGTGRTSTSHRIQPRTRQLATLKVSLMQNGRSQEC